MGARAGHILVAGLIALTVGAGNLHASTASQRDGHLVFITGESSDLGPTPRLIAMDADGSHRRMLLGWVNQASLSPDGRTIAYERVGQFRGHAIREIRLVAAADGATGDRRVVLDGEQPAWSPTGRAIAFVRGIDTGNIWIRDLGRRTEHLILHNGAFPAWSPDGRHVAFERGGGIWLATSSGKGAHRIVRNGRSPAFSSRGWIAFEGEHNTWGYVFAGPPGGHPRPLFEGGSPAWSPNGQEIAFDGPSRRGGAYDAVIRERLDGSGRRILFRESGTGPCACRFISWGP